MKDITIFPIAKTNTSVRKFSNTTHQCPNNKHPEGSRNPVCRPAKRPVRFEKGSMIDIYA
jgi:hypothetical protein